jgi:hypothetical protein
MRKMLFVKYLWLIGSAVTKFVTIFRASLAGLSEGIGRYQDFKSLLLSSRGPLPTVPSQRPELPGKQMTAWQFGEVSRQSRQEMARF